MHRDRSVLRAAHRLLRRPRVIITTIATAGYPIRHPDERQHGTQIIESLISAEQGVKSVFPQVNLQGCLAQDLGDMRVLPMLMRQYLDRFGYTDVTIPGVFREPVASLSFPRLGSAFATSVTRRPSPLWAGQRRGDEDGGRGRRRAQHGLSSAELPGGPVDLRGHGRPGVRGRQRRLRQEEEVAAAEVTAILDKVLEMGAGDIAVGTIKAVEAGVLDSPMSINIHAQDKVLGIRDRNGACRYLEFGNLPIPEEIKDFHRQKVAEREAAEGRTLDYYAGHRDFWAISKGRLKGFRPTLMSSPYREVDVVIAGSGRQAWPRP